MMNECSISHLYVVTRLFFTSRKDQKRERKQIKELKQYDDWYQVYPSENIRKLITRYNSINRIE
jgi:hypothetical protein